MQKPSADETVLRVTTKLHDHAQRMRVKAWQMSQGSNHVEAQQLLAAADACDRSLVPMVLRDASAWKR